MEELIARRQFAPLYIWLDIAFLCVFLALLLWKRKYMTVLVGLRNFMMYGRYVYADEIKIPDCPPYPVVLDAVHRCRRGGRRGRDAARPQREGDGHGCDALVFSGAPVRGRAVP